MKKILLVLGILLVLISTVLVFANGQHRNEIEEGKRLIESKVSCDSLNEEQLEAIGDYLMEQMHPGESHEIMDEMMGGEGSESLEQMHINMARMMYCNEGDMMEMMGAGMNCPMMNGNMMGNMMNQGGMGSMMGDKGMMGGMMNRK